MPTQGFQEAIEAICSGDARFARDAYAFLRDALDATLKRRKKEHHPASGGHVSAAELLDGFRRHALQEFGPMALTVLEYWGVRSCEDVGRMVFHLIDAKIFGKTDEDSIEEFRNGFDFEEAFVHPFRAHPRSLNARGSSDVGKRS